MLFIKTFAFLFFLLVISRIPGRSFVPFLAFHVDHNVIVMDKKGVKGIPLSKLMNKETVILQVTNKRN